MTLPIQAAHIQTGASRAQGGLYSRGRGATPLAPCPPHPRSLPDDSRRCGGPSYAGPHVSTGISERRDPHSSFVQCLATAGAVIALQHGAVQQACSGGMRRAKRRAHKDCVARTLSCSTPVSHMVACSAPVLQAGQCETQLAMCCTTLCKQPPDTRAVPRSTGGDSGVRLLTGIDGIVGHQESCDCCAGGAGA